MDILLKFLQTTGFGLMEPGNAIMIVIGCVFIALAIIKDYEPLLLLPIGFGVIVGNIPYRPDMSLGVYDDGGIVVSEGEVVVDEPEDPDGRALSRAPVSLENLSWVFLNTTRNEDNTANPAPGPI